MSDNTKPSINPDHKIILGADHAGFELKEKIKGILPELGWVWSDAGCNSTASCDYPDYARAVAKAVSQGHFDRGIICCGSGIGVSIVANKVRAVRAALCYDIASAMLARQHNDANVLCIGARLTDHTLSLEIVMAFLQTSFAGGHHQDRINKIEVPRRTQ